MFENLFPWRTDANPDEGCSPETGTTDERPPKPDPKPRSESGKLTRYEATITYRNGDTETFECYGIRERTDSVVRFNVDPYGSLSSWRNPDVVVVKYDSRDVHYEVLAREPEVEEIGMATVRLEWVERHKYRLGPPSSPSPEWVPAATDIELTIETDD